MSRGETDNYDLEPEEYGLEPNNAIQEKIAPTLFDLQFGRQLLEKVKETLSKITSPNLDQVIATLQFAKGEQFYSLIGITHYYEVNDEAMLVEGYENLSVRESGYIIWLTWNWEERVWHLNFGPDPADPVLT